MTLKIWIKALLIAFIIIIAIKVSVYAATGMWQQIGFPIGSESMKPNIRSGDLILVQSFQRTDIITYEDGKVLNYKSFNDYGDVIAYNPKGTSRSLIIHRAMYYVDKGKPMWPGGPPAPHAGYITKGDNNDTNYRYDQMGAISYNQPVKKEWIIGVARLRTSYLGQLYLFLFGESSVVILVYAVVFAIVAWYLPRMGKRSS